MAFGLEYLPPTGKATDYTDFADGLRPWIPASDRGTTDYTDFTDGLRPECRFW